MDAPDSPSLPCAAGAAGRPCGDGDCNRGDRRTGPGEGLRDRERRDWFDFAASGAGTVSNVLAGGLTTTQCAAGGMASTLAPVATSLLLLIRQGGVGGISAWGSGDAAPAPLLGGNGPGCGQAVDTMAAVCDCVGCCDN